MQVQIKRQLKIELDQADITEAVRAYLAGNGYTISAEDLGKINYVKSPRDGLRAELNITEESGAEPEVIQVDTSVPETTAAVTSTETETAAPESTEAEALGEVATPTIADVAPNVEAAVDLVLAEMPETDEPEPEEAPVVEQEAEAPRTKLFM